MGWFAPNFRKFGYSSPENGRVNFLMPVKTYRNRQISSRAICKHSSFLKTVQWSRRTSLPKSGRFRKIDDFPLNIVQYQWILPVILFIPKKSMSQICVPLISTTRCSQTVKITGTIVIMIFRDKKNYRFAKKVFFIIFSSFFVVELTKN